PPVPALFPYTTLFRSLMVEDEPEVVDALTHAVARRQVVADDPVEDERIGLPVQAAGQVLPSTVHFAQLVVDRATGVRQAARNGRSEEHTSELQSRENL